mmetsp:Transcript_48646/g.143705  ORF Transcript_48646/g.143705 Transcript_48646/m.143705 type:complete len:207 (-) Transcript_48646:123-743(-)
MDERGLALQVLRESLARDRADGRHHRLAPHAVVPSLVRVRRYERVRRLLGDQRRQVGHRPEARVGQRRRVRSAHRRRCDAVAFGDRALERPEEGGHQRVLGELARAEEARARGELGLPLRGRGELLGEADGPTASVQRRARVGRVGHLDEARHRGHPARHVARRQRRLDPFERRRRRQVDGPREQVALGQQQPISGHRDAMTTCRD